MSTLLGNLPNISEYVLTAAKYLLPFHYITVRVGLFIVCFVAILLLSPETYRDLRQFARTAMTYRAARSQG